MKHSTLLFSGLTALLLTACVQVTINKTEPAAGAQTSSSAAASVMREEASSSVASVADEKPASSDAAVSSQAPAVEVEAMVEVDAMEAVASSEAASADAQ